MSEQNVTLECGTAIINVFKGQPLKWKQMLSEWIDNSFGAGARQIIFRKDGRTLSIIDDGQGCDDLKIMESLARSVKRPGNKASMYGIGGLMSQIHASQAGKVEVESITKGKMSRIVVDWGECLANDKLSAEFKEIPAAKGMKTGTTIIIHNCKRLGDVEKLARDLGYSYSGELGRRRSIVLDIDGTTIKVRPYRHPPFSREVKLDYDFQGHRITGFCGLVERGQSNPFPGWSVHWGYRFLGQFHEPADGRLTNRLYGEVYLPETWKDISVTKDSFIQDQDAFWRALAAHCLEIIELAEAETHEIQLTSTTRAAEEIIDRALGRTRRIKGARPGDAGESGTVEPTGRGGEHKRFTTSQPGDKADSDEAIADRAPDRVRIVWDGTIEEIYKIARSDSPRRTFSIFLNESVSQLVEFRSDPGKLATLCLGLVAKEIAETPDGDQRLFPAFRDMEFKEVWQRLLSRIVTASTSPQLHSA